MKIQEFCDTIYTEVKSMSRLRRKIDQYLVDWKNDKNKMPLIVKGARQIGKTDSIENFAKSNYKNLETCGYFPRLLLILQLKNNT